MLGVQKNVACLPVSARKILERVISNLQLRTINSPANLNSRQPPV